MRPLPQQIWELDDVDRPVLHDATKLTRHPSRVAQGIADLRKKVAFAPAVLESKHPNPAVSLLDGGGGRARNDQHAVARFAQGPRQALGVGPQPPASRLGGVVA